MRCTQPGTYVRHLRALEVQVLQRSASCKWAHILDWGVVEEERLESSVGVKGAK